MFVIRAPLCILLLFGSFFSLLKALYEFLEQPLLEEKIHYSSTPDVCFEVYNKNLDSMYMFLGLTDQRRNFHSTNVTKAGADSAKATDQAVQVAVDTAKKYPKSAMFVVGAAGTLVLLNTLNEWRMKQEMTAAGLKKSASDLEVNASLVKINEAQAAAIKIETAKSQLEIEAIKAKSQAEIQAIEAKAQAIQAKTELLRKNFQIFHDCAKDPKCPIDRYKILVEKTPEQIARATVKAGKQNNNLNSPLENGDNFDLIVFLKKFFVNFLENLKDFM